MNKQDIIDEMRVIPVIDPNFEISRRVEFIQNQLINAGAKTLVLGISGGVDSSTCGRLAQLAVDGLNKARNCSDLDLPRCVCRTVSKKMRKMRRFHFALYSQV